MTYYVYKLRFRKQNKFYIGCTKRIGARFQEHLCSWFWIDKGIIPEGLDILFSTENVALAAAHELKLINSTWEDNVNSMELMYPIHNDDNLDEELNEERLSHKEVVYKEIEEREFKEIRRNNLAKDE